MLAGTPLGRVSDASQGLRDALANADVIAAEDTRRLHRLAADLGVALSGPVISYYESVEQARIPASVTSTTVCPPRIRSSSAGILACSTDS